MKNNFQLFIYNIKKPRSINEKDALIKQTAALYGVSREKLENDTICRSRDGKPFFKESDIYFSVSHTEDLWACLIGPYNCGLDVQYIKPCNFSKIAGRFFSERENKYVDEHGIEGFFELWSRREAWGKYTGEGFFGTVPELVTQKGGTRSKIAVGNGGYAVIREIQLPDILKKVKCAVCFTDKYTENIEIRDMRWDHRQEAKP